AARLRATTARWVAVLGRAGVNRRPEPRVWSPLEYACHVRDVHRVFTDRVALMLGADDPPFPNWDQVPATLHGRYYQQYPDAVAAEVASAADATAAAYDGVPADAW